MYNTTFIDTNSTIVDWMQGVNTASEGLLITVFLIVLVILLFVTFKGYTDIPTSIFLSTFMTGVIAVFLAGMQIANIWIVSIMFIISMAAMFMLIFGGDKT